MFGFMFSPLVQNLSTLNYNPAQDVDVNLLASGRSGFNIPTTVGEPVQILTPTFKGGSQITKGDKTRVSEHLFDGNSYTLYFKFKVITWTSGNYFAIFGCGTSGSTRGLTLYNIGNHLYFECWDGAAHGAENIVVVNANTVLPAAGWCDMQIIVDYSLKQVRTKIYNEAGVGIGTDITVNISNLVFNTTDNSNSYEFYSPTSSVYGFKKFNAIKTISQCRDIDYITDAQIYIPDLISGTDVTGNGNHFSILNKTLECRYYDTKQEYLLKKGYVRYDSVTDQKITDYIPNAVNGSEVSITTPSNTIKDKLYAGSELYHNLADSLLVFTGAIFDRSNTTLLNSSARVTSIYKNGYYDAANPKRWHPSELNYLKNTFWFNAGYKESIFTKMGGGSLYGRNYIEQIISFSTNKSVADADKVLSYCNESNLMRSKTVQQSITEPAVPVLFGVRTIGVSGANLSISWGNEIITKLVCDGTIQTLFYIYPASGAFEFRIVGELDKLLHYDSSNSCLDIDITEFSKAKNISLLSFGKANTIIGSINGLTKLKELWFYWPTIEGAGLTGSIDNTPLLEALEIQGNGTNLPIKNITGRFESIPNMKSFCNVSSIYGDISGLKNLEYFSWTNPDPTKKIWGDISDKVNLWCYFGEPGSEDVTGNSINLVNLEIFQPNIGITKPDNLQHMPKLCKFVAKWNNVTEANVNQYLADILANREVVRTHYKNTVATGVGYRYIVLNQYNIPAPTGQGIVDRNNLRITKSPAIPGDGEVWTVLTN